MNTTTVTEQLREKRLLDITPIVSDFYRSPEEGKILFELFQRFQLDYEKYSRFALMLGDYLLGLSSESDLATDLKRTFEHLTSEQVMEISSQWREAIKLNLGSDAEQVQETSPRGNEVPPIRTMNTDAKALGQNVMNPDEEEPVVSGFSQDDLLKRE